MENKDSLRADIYKYIKDTYGRDPEYLWEKSPNYAAFRHSDNRKWFCIIMDAPAGAVNLESGGKIDIINVKVANESFHDMLLYKKGYGGGWHMNHRHWLSISLDGTALLDEIEKMIDESFLCTK